MKILLLIRDLDLGGAQRQLAHLSIGLLRRGHYVTVASWREGGVLANQLRSLGVRLVHIEARWRGDLIGLGADVHRIVQSQGIEIVYCLMPVENLVGLIGCRGTKARLVWGIRTSQSMVRRVIWTQRALFAIQRALSWAPAAIIANSLVGAKLVRGRWPSREVVVIRNGTDTEQFCPNDSLRRLSRERLKVRPEAFIVAVVGRIEPQKGVAVFLEALKGLSKSRPGTVGLLVGRLGHGYGRVLTRLLQREGLSQIVRVIPQQDDIRSIYAAADILVSPSFGEGMSNVVAEAMASGLGVIATRVGDNEALIGSAGWLVRAGDRKELEAALLAAASANLLEVGAMARNRIQTYFSVEALVDQTEGVLCKVVKCP